MQHPTHNDPTLARIIPEVLWWTGWLNCTLRQRVSRLVRKTLSFSKKLENHIGAIFYFIHHYNATLRARAQWA